MLSMVSMSYGYERDVRAIAGTQSIGREGDLKKTKLSTQFLVSAMLRACRMAIMASATHPKAKPVLAVLKGATWSM